ncbi:MAG: DUF4388 domain-containing protein, partial [Syntrophorhabdaceae bacterium]|nr:DUF4388 domain-containing protein [Syntrophorhabdaceae bacterium]
QVEETVLLLTRQVYLKNVLPSLFEREGIRLVMTDSPAEAPGSMQTAGCARILVSEECREEFENIAGAPENAGVFPEISYFRTVGRSMLDNPASYDRIFKCLLTALQSAAAARNPAVLSILTLINGDILEIGKLLRLPRLVIDGLRIGACLMVPASEKGPPKENAQGVPRLFLGIDASVEAARRLAFPWDVAKCLEALKKLPASGNMAVALGVLSLAWYRHYYLSSLRSGSGVNQEALNSKLRVQAGKLAPSSVVEAYIRVLEQHDHGVGSGRSIFIVGDADPVPQSLRSELRNHGFRVVEYENFQEARKAYLRLKPAAVLTYVDSSRSEADDFCRYIREEASDRGVAIIGITQRNDPSFLMNLMDTCFNDVLTIPIDAPVAVARISRALPSREKRVDDRKGFSATFKDLSFIDLVQTLVGGGRDVKMLVSGPGGQKAEIYFREGKVVYADTGKVKGPDAFYQVVLWQSEGRFRVEPVTKFPESNITLPTDYILLEGLRRLDEGLAEQ